VKRDALNYVPAQ